MTHEPIRACSESDAAAIRDIYNYYVENSVATFEETPVSSADMAQRIGDTCKRYPWLVWEHDGSILGYACATEWKSRSAYRFSAESTVYLSPDATGKGIGTQLYRRLLEEMPRLGIRCIVAGISLPNASSVALHEKLGFRYAGCLHGVGYKFGRWIDVGYWELPIGGGDPGLAPRR